MQAENNPPIELNKDILQIQAALLEMDVNTMFRAKAEYLYAD